MFEMLEIDKVATDTEALSAWMRERAVPAVKQVVGFGAKSEDAAREFIGFAIAEGSRELLASLALPFMDPDDVLLAAASASMVYALGCDAVRDIYAGREPELMRDGKFPTLDGVFHAFVEDMLSYSEFSLEMDEPTLGGEMELNESVDGLLHDAVARMGAHELAAFFCEFCDARAEAERHKGESGALLGRLCER